MATPSKHLIRAGSQRRRLSEIAERIVSAARAHFFAHGVDANHARIIQGYAQGAVGQWMARRAAQGYGMATGPIAVQSRMSEAGCNAAMKK